MENKYLSWMPKDKYGIFAVSYLAAFGGALFVGMIMQEVNPERSKIFEPEFLRAIAVGIFLNLLTFFITFRQNAPLKEYWIRRILWFGEVAIITPLVFIVFGCIEPQRRLTYFMTSVVVVELLMFVAYLFLDWRITRMTIDKINETLKKNREE